MSENGKMVYHLDDLSDEQIQTVILQGFQILSIRAEVPMLEIIQGCLDDLSEEADQQV